MTHLVQRGLEFFLSALPEPWMFVVLAPVFLAYAVAAAWFAGWLRIGRGVKTSYTRKIFHFSIFTTAGLLQITWGLPAVSLFGGIVACVVLYAVWRGDDFPFYEAMARESDRPRRSLFILVPLATTAIGGLASNLFFPQFAFVGYLVCGWGDALGEPVGARWGKHGYRVPSIAGVRAHRTLEGSAAVCIGGAVAAATGLSLFGLPPAVAISVGIGCGVFGAAVEAVSNHGLDNLTIQIAASAAAFLLLT
jgi:phytol kinase